MAVNYRSSRPRCSVATRTLTIPRTPAKIAQYDEKRAFASLLLGSSATATYKIGRTQQECIDSPSFPLTSTSQIKVYGDREVWLACSSAGGATSINVLVQLVCEG